MGDGFQKTAGELFRFSETAVLDSTFTSTKFTFGGNEAEPASRNRSPIEWANRGGRLAVVWRDSIPTAYWTMHSPATDQWPRPFRISGVLIQTDGKIVVVGNRGEHRDWNHHFEHVARYLGNSRIGHSERGMRSWRRILFDSVDTSP